MILYAEIKIFWNPEVIIFSHIPKTAGTSLRKIIDYNHNPNSICYCYGGEKDFKSIYKQIESLSKNLLMEDLENQIEQVNKIRVLGGHIGFGVHDLLPPRSFKYITLFRDPVQRVISYYLHLKRHFKNDLGDTARAKSLKEFVLCQTSIEVDNWQTRYISGLGWQGSMLRDRPIMEYGSCSQEMLDLAKRNLRQYYIFGFQEKFKESLGIFSKYLGWNVTPDIKANVNEARQNQAEFDRETLDIIAEHNKLDYELYRYAESLFSSVYCPKLID